MLGASASVASAHMPVQKMLNGEHLSTQFTRDASLLGVTVEEVKNAWAEGKPLMVLAKEKGVDIQSLKTQLKEKRVSEMKSGLDEKVSSGKITRAQADEKIRMYTQRESDRKAELATALGISTLELETYQAAGKTLPEITKERGMSAESVHATLKKNREIKKQDQLKTQLNTLVKDGVITQAQANKKISHMNTREGVKGSMRGN